MKDQPTEAPVDPFHVHRLWGPTARFHRPLHVRPFTIEQRKGVVKGQTVRRVFGQRMKGENEDKPASGWATSRALRREASSSGSLAMLPWELRP